MTTGTMGCGRDEKKRVVFIRVACVSIVLATVGQVEGQTAAQVKRVQHDLEAYYLNRFVELKVELPYVKRAVVINKTNELKVQPIDPEDRAEERYAKITRKHRIFGLKVEQGQVVFRIAPSYLSPRMLPTPPINPEEPPWKPEEPPPPPKPSKIPFKRVEPVHFTVVLEYSSLNELTPDRINARLQPVLCVITSERLRGSRNGNTLL
ncbi:MAG: hypothetical protein QXS96_08470 [Candidatus Caldarchaeum sp.]